MHPGLIAGAAAALVAPFLLLGGGSGAAVALAATSVTTAPAPVVVDGAAVNADPVVVTGQNGQLDPAVLCYSSISPKNSMGLLQCPAAAALDRLAVAFEAGVGEPLCFGNGYRTLGQQIRLERAKPNLAAKAGTSNHGWGLAVDLCGGIERFGTREHAWMRANASAYGWVLPGWAQERGSRPEPWHWEYGNL